MQFIKYEDIIKEETHCHCKLLLEWFFFYLLGWPLWNKCACVAEQIRPISFVAVPCKKKKSTQRIKHLHPTKLNYVAIITVLYHVKSVFTYLFVPATWCFELITKMVLTSSELCCLASCCLKSSHPFSIMILAGSQSPPMPGSDYTFFFFFRPQPSVCQIAPTWCHKSALCLVLASGHTRWPRPRGAQTWRAVATSTFRGTGLCFVLSQNTLYDMSHKVTKKGDTSDFPCCGR